MDDQISPPYFAVTPENHSAWIVATSIIFLIYSAMAVVGKITIRINLTQIKLPEIFLITSLVMLVTQTALIVASCNNGLGQHRSALSIQSFERYSTRYYAASILAIAIQAATKISVCLWIAVISPQARVLQANRILMGVITVWTVSGILALAFACGIPHPWRSSEGDICTSLQSIRLYNGILNILTDFAICILPVTMMWSVQTSLRKKCAVCALFASRIFCPAFTIPALATSQPYYENLHADQTWHAVVPTILGQISVNLSVLTACIPGLKSILDSLFTGGLHARIQGGYNITSSGDKKSPFIITPDTPSARNTRGRSLGTNSHTNLSSKIADRLGLRKDSSKHDTSRSGGRMTSESERNLTEGGITRTDQWEVTTMTRDSSSGVRPGFGPRVSDPDQNQITYASSQA